ncbi:MAG TPA: sugar phosphate isomerase/epimerase [Armatimonadota bacterium]|jgi:sugar phosphate isomerase/epimerase
MALATHRLKDGTNSPPRLRLSHALWALIHLPRNGPEWSLAEKCRRVKEEGFEALECWLTPEGEKEVRDALDHAGLRLALGHHPYTLDDTRQAVAQAKRLNADYLIGQVGDAFLSDQEAALLVRDCRALAADEGVPLFVETHRGTVTESLAATYRLLQAVPDLTFTADVSHYFVAGEFGGTDLEPHLSRLLPVLKRTSSIHGRVSNGEQVQVDVGDGSGPLAQLFMCLWAEAMVCWLHEAEPGDILPFTPELGPPGYAIVHPNGTGELSDRWKQSLVIKQLGQEAWARATRVVGS